MTLAEQILAAIEGNKTAVTAAIARVADDVAALKSKAESGNNITAAEAQAILDGLAAIKTTVDSVDPIP